MYGTLKKYKGRVEFDYVFSGTPDVWLRNSSSGTEVRTVPYYYPALIQYYDPYGSKSIEVNSVDKYGFTFEMKYWEIAFYKMNPLYPDQYVGTINVPNMNNIHIDYTAVGNETNYLNQAPSAPQNLSVSAAPTSYGQPILNWDNNTESNMNYYKIYRKQLGEGPYRHIGSSSSSSYNDWEVSMVHGNDIVFLYVVKAVNTIGKESAFSNMVSVDGYLMISLQREDVGQTETIPENFALKNNYPNPFNPTTKIAFELPEASDVTLKIYNIMGQEVATLVSTNLHAGFHEAIFDARNVSSGMYIARMRAVGNTGQVFTKDLKMQLIK